MIRITQLKLSIDHSKEELIHKIQKALRQVINGWTDNETEDY